MRRQPGPVEPVEQELTDDGKNEAEQDGDGGAEWVAPVHQVVGVRTTVWTATIADEVHHVEEDVDKTSRERVDHVVEPDWNSIDKHVDDDVDRVERMFQL